MKISGGAVGKRLIQQAPAGLSSSAHNTSIKNSRLGRKVSHHPRKQSQETRQSVNTYQHNTYQHNIAAACFDAISSAGIDDDFFDFRDSEAEIDDNENEFEELSDAGDNYRLPRRSKPALFSTNISRILIFCPISIYLIF